MMITKKITLWLIVLLCLGATTALAQTGTTTDDDEPIFVPVIVQLDLPTRPDAQLAGPNAVRFQRGWIDATQDRLSTALQAEGITTLNERRFETVGAVALFVAESDLDDLRVLPQVAAVVPDRISLTTMTNERALIGAPEANTTYGWTGDGYAVAVLDTGVDFTHPALSGHRVQELCFSSSSDGFQISIGGFTTEVVSACPNGAIEQIGGNAARPYDGVNNLCYGCDHGTHVAGIAAGSAIGYSGGVAPEAGIIGVQVFSIFTDTALCGTFGSSAFAPCTVSYTSDQMRAMEYLYLNRNTFSDTLASVNMSLGGGQYTSDCNSDYPNQYLNAVTNLVNNRIAVIASSGNDGFTDAIGSPACISNIIAVGSVNDNDTVSGFSNAADIMDLFAPGSGVYAPVPDSGHGSKSGTSMSAPMVAGAWALFRQAYPNATVDQLLSWTSNVGPPIVDVNTTRPRLNVAGTVPRAGLSITTLPTVIEESSNGQVIVRLQMDLPPGASLNRSYTIPLIYGGTATRNVDYTAPSSVTVAHNGGDGDTSVAFAINVSQDDLEEGNETLTLRLGEANRPGVNTSDLVYTIDLIDLTIPATGILSIDQTAEVLQSDAELEGFTRQVPLRLVVVDGPPNLAGFTATVSYGGTAQSGTDFTAPATIDFAQSDYAAGVYTATIPVVLLDDGANQRSPRTFNLTLTGVNNPDVTLQDVNHAFTIYDAVRNIDPVTQNELLAAIQQAIAVNALPLEALLVSYQGDDTITLTVGTADGTVGTVQARFLGDGVVATAYESVTVVTAGTAPEDFEQTVRQVLPVAFSGGLALALDANDLPSSTTGLYRISLQPGGLVGFYRVE